MAGSSKEKLNGMIISDTSIRQPVFITMIMLLTLVIGLLSYTSLPVNLLPDISIPTIAVVVSYPGAGPESVADQVAKPIENTLNTLNGVKHITSNSSEGVTQIIAEFDTSVDVNKAEQDVREKVNAIRPQLPTDVRDPNYFKFDPNDLPILTIAVSAEGSRSPLELHKLIDDDIAPQLQRVTGVGSVTVNGGQLRQINVQMDLSKLKAWQILPVQITRAIQTANSTLGLGSITVGNQDISLRAPSMIQTPQDIARIQITGTPYRVGDVAAIEDGVAEATSYARLDGADAITISIRKQSGSNTIQVADDVKAAIQTIFAAQPDLKYFIPSDQSTFIRQSTNSAIEELLIASLAAMVIVLLFFRDIRNTLVTVAGLPVIMIGTFAALKLFGLTINLMTLLAMSLSVGLVIDDAIVVRENVFRHMERGQSPRIASSRGTAEVALSVLAMSLTIIAVFLPVTFTSGITGIIFRSFGLTVASAMAISLIEAFTLAPMLSAFFFKQKLSTSHHAADVAGSEHDSLLDEASEDPGALGRLYERLLAWSLRHRMAVVAIAVVVLLLSGLVASTLKVSFFPSQDSGQFTIGFDMTPGTPMAQTDEVARRAEAVLKSDPAIEAVLTSVGGVGNSEHGEFSIKLHEGTKTQSAEDRLRAQLDFLPKLAFSQASFGPSSTGVTGRQLQISVQTTRPVSEIVPQLQQLQTQTQGIVGLVDIDTTYKPGKPELQFHVDPAKIGDLGVTNDDIANSVRALISGSRATTYREPNGDDTDVVVRLKPGDRAGVDSIRSISVPTRAGSVPLSSLVRVELASGPTTVRRYDRQNQILIGANVVGRNVNEVQQEIAGKLQGSNLPSDLNITFTGSIQQQQQGFGTLLIAMALSVLFVYMVLASQFGSFLQPLVIMLAMPFSFIGAFLALRLTGFDLDIIGMIGLIMLLGLVVKNSILLVDFANRLRDAGMEKHAALEHAGAVRLRPILMTTLALVAGSIPVAIGIGEGSEFRRSLSIVLIGGLLTSMVLTLLVVPTAYSLLDSVTQRSLGLLRRKPAAEPALAGAAIDPAGYGESNGSGEAHGAGNGVAQPASLPIKKP
ncbi:MAG: efflux RND transporter permease subunit [Kouleothrix sp.]|nr:efflux RND transporter permease subunit [Kouleothrix sp.]